MSNGCRDGWAALANHFVLPIDGGSESGRVYSVPLPGVEYSKRWAAE
jgi:hypothetical protein